MRYQIIFFSLLLCVRRLNGYFLHIASNDTVYGINAFYPDILLNNPGLDPNVQCDGSNEPCMPYNAICGPLKRCMCRTNFEFDNLGICIDCPMDNHICGYNGCCGGDTLVCYYGLCKPCVRDGNTGRCITKEQLMYTTLSQISLALALVLGILALITLLYKTCKKPSTMFGHSQRLGGRSRQGVGGVAVVGDHRRASITSTQRRVLTQLRDRPPRYERQETTTANPNPVSRNTHALGEPPPLYSEVTETQGETREVLAIEPPPAYSAEFPTISSVTFSEGVKIDVEDEVASTSATSMENLKDDKPPGSPPEEAVTDEERIVQR